MGSWETEITIIKGFAASWPQWYYQLHAITWSLALNTLLSRCLLCYRLPGCFFFPAALTLRLLPCSFFISCSWHILPTLKVSFGWLQNPLKECSELLPRHFMSNLKTKIHIIVFVQPFRSTLFNHTIIFAYLCCFYLEVCICRVMPWSTYGLETEEYGRQ